MAKNSKAAGAATLTPSRLSQRERSRERGEWCASAGEWRQPGL